MRGILFRGKRINDGKWVYGDYCSLPFNPYILYEDNDGGLVKANINVMTLGQYTGLTDKNDRKIFEGDILDGEDYNSEDGFGVVQWDEDNACFECVQNDGLSTMIRTDFGWLDSKAFIVIGNIHDNPELLKDEV